MLRSGDIVEQSEHRRAVLAISLVPQAPRAGKHLMLTVVGASMWDVARLLDAISGGLGRFSTREFGATADIEASEAQDVCHFLT